MDFVEWQDVSAEELITIPFKHFSTTYGTFGIL